MKIRLLFLLFIFSPLAFSQEMDVLVAKKKADQDERGLTKEDSTKLLQAQTLMVNSVMPECMKSTGLQPNKSFLVVVRIGKDGNPNKSWLRGKYPLSICFEKGMTAQLKYVPKSEPFYTSFDYTFKP